MLRSDSRIASQGRRSSGRISLESHRTLACTTKRDSLNVPTEHARIDSLSMDSRPIKLRGDGQTKALAEIRRSWTHNHSVCLLLPHEPEPPTDVDFVRSGHGTRLHQTRSSAQLDTL